MTWDTESRSKNHSRRAFLSAALAVPLAGASLGSKRLVTLNAGFSSALVLNDVTVSSPDRKLRFDLLWRGRDRLSYRIALSSKPVIEPSAAGIIIDGLDLGQGVEIGRVDTYRLQETYATRGVHSQAVNHCNGAKISVKHAKSNSLYMVEVRAFNDGIAFRYIVPGAGQQRVPDEVTTFTIPAGSTAWFHDFEGHYEGVHSKKEISEIKPGEWAAPPLTVKLPNGLGYASLTEAALIDYAGMGFRADGQRRFSAVLGHALPVSHPFDLRYGAAEAKRLAAPAAISGTITTPWRVVIAGSDLNTLVNSDVISNVSPPPDRRIFAAGLNTEWIRPGRCVWKYLNGGESTLEGMKEFSRLAGELGFEYNMVEGFWQRWSESQMRELIDYSRQQKVGIWFWKHSRDLRTPGNRQQFFTLCNSLGVVGAKIDFFDHEAKEIIDLYQTLLQEAAEHKILLEFHGANKPAGESRTWPNEMSREAVRGMEASRMTERATHNTTLPFTRFLAGHADYTPMHFGERRRETSWGHQIASAAIFTSPLLIYGAHPSHILDNPAVDLIKSIPSVWDETIALPSSEIGEIAAFARRTAANWFLAIMNGPTARTVQIPLSFLGSGSYGAALVKDRLEDSGAVKIESDRVNRKSLLVIEMRPGGGFIARFSPGS